MSSCVNLTVARSFHVLRRWLRRAPMMLMIVSLAPAGAPAQTNWWSVLPGAAPPARLAGQRQQNRAGRL